MFFKYLSRELLQRKRQTGLLTFAIAIAVGLVVVVNAASSGISSAQSQVLGALYGIGTDITVSQTSTPNGNPGNGQRFQFNPNSGSQDGPRDAFNISQDQLEIARFSQTISEGTTADFKRIDGVAAITATLKLNSISFNGSIANGTTDPGIQSGDNASNMSSNDQNPRGVFGGANFQINQKSIEGIDPAKSNVGPLNQVTIISGRNFEAEDSGRKVAVVDEQYAKTESIKVDSTILLKSESFKVVGIVTSANSSSALSSNIYIPLDTAQALTSHNGEVTNFYISASSAKKIAQVKSDISKLLPDATVSTESDLAASLSGSLSSASSLINKLGKWLSVIVLIVAFGLVSLFTSAGVTRRIREFGTLKAIGWKNSRIAKQILGEALATSAIGALVGAMIATVGIFVINAIAPTLTTYKSLGSFRGFPGGAGAGDIGGGFPGGGMQGGALQNSASTLQLHTSLSMRTLAIALAVSILGALIASSMGILRASKLTPASALRSVA